MNEPLTRLSDDEVETIYAAYETVLCGEARTLDGKRRIVEPLYDAVIAARIATATSVGGPLDAARASQPLPDLATLLKDDVRALAHLTPEQWDERRGLDPIARTINAVFDIIDARLATPAASSEAAASQGDEGPCDRCGRKRDAGCHDTREFCEDTRGPCLDPASHHPFAALDREASHGEERP